MAIRIILVIPGHTHQTNPPFVLKLEPDTPQKNSLCINLRVVLADGWDEKDMAVKQ